MQNHVVGMHMCNCLNTIYSRQQESRQPDTNQARPTKIYDAILTCFIYMSTNEGSCDLGFHPPKRDPFNVLPLRNSP